MNPNIDHLHPYPFQKLATLFEGAEPPAVDPIPLSIGEPRHPAPDFVIETLARSLPRVAEYPGTKGLPELRQAIAGWASRRFGLGEGGLDPETQVLPVNGTREALFAFAQAALAPGDNPVVLTPNPFYQIYEGAALLGGATPVFINASADGAGLPAFEEISEETWNNCQLLYVCSPGNPNGAVMGVPDYEKLIEKADRHDFVIAADECYSEIYPREDQPPTGLLEACRALGRDDFNRCLAFHSLSKRSNLPGLRSGFVAGDAERLATFLRYRTYHGCAMPIHHQLASISAWNDESHVVENRSAYRRKFEAVVPILSPWLDVAMPEAGFYLWPRTPIDDETFARQLFAEEHVTVLPGSYLSRTSNGINPGSNRVRMALVAEEAQCIEAANRIARFMERHQFGVS